MGIADDVFTIGKIVATSIAESTGAILNDVIGHVGFGDNPDDESTGEESKGMPSFGSLGVVGRALKQSRMNGKAAYVEAILLRFKDSLIPVVVRDLRINKRAFPNGLAEGQTGIANYGGASLTHSIPNGENGGSVGTWYVPYDFNSSGVPQKCHAIVIDPSGGITIAHGDGMAVVMGDGGLTLRSQSGVAYLNLNGDTIAMRATNITIQGKVAMGGNPAIAVPLAAGPASPPGPNVFISPA